MTDPIPEWADEVVERRLSEMTDAELLAVIARTRKPEEPPNPKGTHVPDVGRKPSSPPGVIANLDAAIDVARAEGDRATEKQLRAAALNEKTAKLTQLMHHHR